MKQKYITVLPIALLALSASYGIYSFSLLFVPWYIAGITALAFELTYCTLVFIDSAKVKPVSIMAVIVSVLWNVGHSMFVLYPASVEMIYNSLLLSFVISVIHGLPLATLAYLVAEVSLHTSESGNTSQVKGKEKGNISQVGESGNGKTSQVVESGKTSHYKASNERNVKLLLDKQAGMTSTELSNKYGISRQRVNQIVGKGKE